MQPNTKDYYIIVFLWNYCQHPGSRVLCPFFLGKVEPSIVGILFLYFFLGNLGILFYISCLAYQIGRHQLERGNVQICWTNLESKDGSTLMWVLALSVVSIMQIGRAWHWGFIWLRDIDKIGSPNLLNFLGAQERYSLTALTVSKRTNEAWICCGVHLHSGSKVHILSQSNCRQYSWFEGFFFNECTVVGVIHLSYSMHVLLSPGH